MSDDIAALRDALTDRAEALCFTLIPSGRIEAGEFVAAGSDTGFGKIGVVLRGSKAGRVGFWGGRPDKPGVEGGDLIHLIMAVHGLGLREALTWAREWLGGAFKDAPAPPPVSRTQRDESEAAKLKWKVDKATGLWRQAKPGLKGTLGEVYLRSRGIVLDLSRFSDDVRFLPRAEWWRGRQGQRPGPVFPAIVCALRQQDGGVMGAHFTFLAKDGHGKAPVDAPKLMMGIKKGSSIVLQEGEPGGLVVINEGVENGATVMMAHGRAERALVAPDVTGFGAIALPPGCPGVVVVPHNDWTNDQAIGQFRRGLKALREQGVPVKVMRASDDVNDPNDMVRGR